MSKRPVRIRIVRLLQWAREDHRAFQVNRADLIEKLDQTLAMMTESRKGDALSMALDGEVIAISDYLAVRPEQAETIGGLVRRGQLEVGPWHVVPAASIVSGEAFVRNLLIGTQITGAMKVFRGVGLLRAEHGVIDQFPQLSVGFAIERWAVSNDGMDTGVYRWIAPDGSQVDLVNAYDAGGDAFSGTADPTLLASELRNLASVLNTRRGEESLAFVRAGDDGRSGLPGMPVAAAGALARGVAFVVEPLTSSVNALAETSSRAPKHFGGFAGLFSVSARALLKQRNHAVQELLTKFAEPLQVWSSLFATERSARGVPIAAGGTATRALTRHAWTIALQNHRPQTLAGQTADQVYHEALARFEQAEQIGSFVVDSMLTDLARTVDVDGAPIEGVAGAILVYNTSDREQTTAVEVVVPSTTNHAVEFSDSDRNPALFVVSQNSADDNRDVGQLRGKLLAVAVPPMGYRMYRYRMSEAPAPVSVFDGGASIENDLLHVTVDQSTGELSLFDKRSGRSFDRLNRYVDNGDCGDTFTYCPPEHDTFIDIATNTPLFVERETSPVEQTLRFLQIFRVPRQLTEARDARLPLAAQFVPLSIQTTVRLVSGVPRVEIEASVTNSALDHRLRAHFLAGEGYDSFLIDTPFAIRSIDLPQGGRGQSARESRDGLETQSGHATVLGSNSGLTIASRGLPEIEAISTDGGVELALTLLRCVGWLSRDDLANRQGHAGMPVETPDAQCIGDYKFHYSIIPHGIDVFSAWEVARNFQSDMRAVVPDMTDHGGLAPTGSLLTADQPAFVVTCVKVAEAENGIIARGYNSSREPVEVSLRPGFGTSHAKRARMDETPVGRAVTHDEHGRYVFKLRPAEILTVVFYPAANS